MAIVLTPASIVYTPDGGVEQIINFDVVLAEDHMATAKVTKFPVQTGFHVTNHSIRENRKVSLTGVISNIKFTAAVGQPNTNYGSNPSSFVKTNLEALVHSGTEARVITNLGEYFPVVFTSFKTGQKAGMIDSMEFTIAGEEIIKANVASFTTPTPVVFTEVTGGARDVVIEELAAVDVFVDIDAFISQGTYNVGSDFVVNDFNEAGKPVQTTYTSLGIDPTTGAEKYTVSVSPASVAVLGAGSVDTAEGGIAGKAVGGISQISGCLLNSATDIALGIVEETIDTAMGELIKDGRNLLYDAVEFAGGQNSAGGMLVKAGVGCLVRGISGNTDVGSYNVGESLPTTDQIMTGAGEGLGFIEPEIKDNPVTLTMIQDGGGGQVLPDVGSLPLQL